MKGLRPLHASQEFKRDFFDNLNRPAGARLQAGRLVVIWGQRAPAMAWVSAPMAADRVAASGAELMTVFRFEMAACSAA